MSQIKTYKRSEKKVLTTEQKLTGDINIELHASVCGEWKILIHD